MNIYFPLETQQRELVGRVLFCIQVAQKGHKAFFGHKSDLFPIIPKLKKGIFVHKSIQARKLSQIKYLKSLGHINCAIDEEGLMISDENEYFNYRCTKECLDELDFFFAWGEKHKSTLIKKYPYLRKKIISAGNSRIDILKNQNNLANKVLKIKEKYGDFILFVTKFGRYNLKKRGLGSWAEMAKINNPQISEENYNKILNSEKHERENMLLMMQAIRNLSKEIPSQNILIRPHPSEEIKTWNEFVSSLDVKNVKNVKVIFGSDSINPWLIAAKRVISHNCTTSLESALLGNISINYLPFLKEEFEYDIPKACSHTVRNYFELKDLIVKKREIKINEELIQHHVHNYGEKTFTDYFIAQIEKSYQNSIHSEENINKMIILLPFAKIYRNIRRYLSLYFGNLRRRRGLSLQKFPGFNLGNVRDIARMYNLDQKIIIKEVWPNVFMFSKK